ncbi:MAG: hypothetical protein AB1553_02060 [Nitrospirota bacterium]
MQEEGSEPACFEGQCAQETRNLIRAFILAKEDFPGVSCDACRDALEKDGYDPECIEGECKLPPLDPLGARILEIRQRLLSLNELVDAGTILRLYDVDLVDLELLAAVEEELKELRDEENKDKNNDPGSRRGK